MAVKVLKVKARESVIDSTRFSKWSKLTGTMGIVLRFIRKCSKGLDDKERGPLMREAKKLKESFLPWASARERIAAEKVLIRQAEIESPPDDEVVRNLRIVKNKDGLLICKGRISNSELKKEAKEPVYMPKMHWSTRLLIQHFHQALGHAGVSHTLSELRQSIWVEHGRQAVSVAISRCGGCRREKAKPYELPEFPQLPEERVRESRPFEFTAVDYFGPIKLKEEGGIEKAWVVLFTCLSTRAVHLETVTTLSAKGFIEAFRMFVSRRGAPSKVLSDNGTSFIPSSEVISEAWNLGLDSSVLSYVESKRIEWKFIPEYSPWAGGVYERVVGIAKKAMSHALGRKKIPLSELRVIVSEAEAIINTRPLTTVGSDEQRHVLRPVDLLTPNCKPGMPWFLDESDDEKDEDFGDDGKMATKIERMWKQSSARLDKFWKLWRTDYLLMLRERYQVKHSQKRSLTKREPRLGEVVIVEEEAEKRGNWRLARITEVSPSKDGAVRAATVKMANGHMTRRPLCHLYPLEISPIEENKEEEKEQTVEATKTQEPEVTTGEPKHKYNLRPRAKIIKASVFFVMIISMLGLFGMGEAKRCAMSSKGQLVFADSCMEHGIVIRKIETGFCFQEVECGPVETLQWQMGGNNPCGKGCECGKDSQLCSHYEGPATVNSTAAAAKSILEQFKPNEICSRKSNATCSEEKVQGKFTMVELYDGSKWPVKALQLHARGSRAVVCFGEGKIDGTPQYCRIHECTPEGTKLCHLDGREILEMQSALGPVVIKSWSIEELAFYPHKPIEAECTMCEAECTRGGIEVKADEGLIVETCVEVFCTRENGKNTSHVSMPEGIVSSKYRPQIRFYQNGRIAKEVKLECEAAPMSSDQLWDFERVRNPQCGSKILIAMVTFVAVLLSWLIFQLLGHYCPGVTKICCFFRMCRGANWMRRRWKVSYEYDEEEKKRQRSPSPRKRLQRVVILSIVIAICTQPTSACSRVLSIKATDAECARGEDGVEKCSFNQINRFTAVAIGQTVCFTLDDHTGTTLGHLEVKLAGAVEICAKKVAYYTRAHVIDVASMRRCYRTGSCTDQKCAETRSTDMPPEIGSSRQYPGFTRCRDACASWDPACLCFFGAPGCHYYRPHARPTSEDVYEIFECDWRKIAVIEVDMHIGNSSSNSKMRMAPGMVGVHAHDKNEEALRIQIEHADYSSEKRSPEKYISDGRRTALLDNEAELNVKNLKCPSSKAARELNCTLNENACSSCEPAGDYVRCICSDGQAAASLLTTASVPRRVEGQWTEVRGEQLQREIPNPVLSILIKVNNVDIKSLYDKARCRFKQKKLEGCARCANGARLVYTCMSSIGSTSAMVSCDNGKQFPILCEKQGSEREIRLNFEENEVATMCVVRCPDSKTNSTITGTLRTTVDIKHNEEVAAAYSIPVLVENSWSLMNSDLPFTLLVIVVSGLIIYLLAHCCPTATSRRGVSRRGRGERRGDG